MLPRRPSGRPPARPPAAGRARRGRLAAASRPTPGGALRPPLRAGHAPRLPDDAAVERCLTALSRPPRHSSGRRHRGALLPPRPAPAAGCGHLHPPCLRRVAAGGARSAANGVQSDRRIGVQPAVAVALQDARDGAEQRVAVVSGHFGAGHAEQDVQNRGGGGHDAYRRRQASMRVNASRIGGVRLGSSHSRMRKNPGTARESIFSSLAAYSISSSPSRR